MMRDVNVNVYSFKKGWRQVPVGIADLVKKELSEMLSIKNAMMWHRRITGQGCSPLSLAEQKAVENIFRKYGITDIWGSE